MTKVVLYGSLTSPYARLCRLVLMRSGAQGDARFEKADPFDPSFRAVNPLGKVPALLMDDGTTCLETTLICRVLMSLGDRSLLPEGEAATRREEADVALMTGLLDLGVAHRLESLRSSKAQSAKWQARRIEGMMAAFPLIENAAERCGERPDGYAAAAFLAALDWLDFRMADFLDWRSACPKAAETLDAFKSGEDAASTDPRVS